VNFEPVFSYIIQKTPFNITNLISYSKKKILGFPNITEKIGSFIYSIENLSFCSFSSIYSSIVSYISTKKNNLKVGVEARFSHNYFTLASKNDLR